MENAASCRATRRPKCAAEVLVGCSSYRPRPPAEQGVDRTSADGTRQQRDKTEVPPRTLRPYKRQAQQREAEQHANYPVQNVLIRRKHFLNHSGASVALEPAADERVRRQPRAL